MVNVWPMQCDSSQAALTPKQQRDQVCSCPAHSSLCLRPGFSNKIKSSVAIHIGIAYKAWPQWSPCGCCLFLRQDLTCPMLAWNLQCNQGWPWSYDSPISTTRVLELQVCLNTPGLCGARDGTQVFIYTRQGIYPTELHPQPSTRFVTHKRLVMVQCTYQRFLTTNKLPV